MMSIGTACAPGIADLPLSFEPGSRTRTTTTPSGIMVGELVRRIDGRKHRALPPGRDLPAAGHRIAVLRRPDAELARVATRVPDSEFNRAEVRQACIPSSGMYRPTPARWRATTRHLGGCAVAVTRTHSAAAESRRTSWTRSTRCGSNAGLGYRLGRRHRPGRRTGALGHVGAAMFGYADPDRRFAIGICEELHRHAAGWDVAEAVYARLERSL